VGYALWAQEHLDVELDHAQIALELLGTSGTDDPWTQATALMLLGGDGLNAGRGLDLDMLHRAVRLEESTSMLVMERPSVQLPIYIGHAGRLEESIALAEAMLADVEAEGGWTARTHIVRMLAWFEYGLGRFDQALRRYREGAAIADELGLDDAALAVVGSQILTVVGLDGMALAEHALDRARATHDRWAQIDGLRAVGFAALTAGRSCEAAEAFGQAVRARQELGFVEPGPARIDGDWIEALLVEGELDQARAATARLVQVAATGGHPWTVMAAARCQGLVAAAEQRLDEAAVWLTRSLDVQAAVPYRFERARTLTALGRVHRQAGRRRAAREALTEAVGILDRAPSPPWRDRAAAELAAVSGRTAGQGLTPGQRRVVELAATGRTNREIATELHMSVRTVESHLSAVYRETGIRSRAELAARHRTGL
jgi:DNA-binding CsgD family transcriptional regulator